MITALILFSWWLSGFLSFVYWYRHDHDVTTAEIPVASIAGIIGPLSFFLGWMIHGKRNGSTRVLFSQLPKK